MPVDLINAVIHGFEKDQHSTVIKSITKKENVLDINLESVKALVEGIAGLLGKKRNSQSWGRFGEAKREGNFYENFSQNASFLEQEDRFLALSLIAMDELVAQAKSRSTSTGGYIMFAFYKDEERVSHLLIAMIKQKGGIRLDENFVPIGIVEVDMSKMHQAADIRIDEYIENTKQVSQNYSYNEEEISEKNYLSFLAQRDSGGEASGYFISALGCEIGLSPIKATNSLFAAVHDFFAKPEIKELRRRAREVLTGYLQQKHENSQVAELTEVCHSLSSILPVEHAALSETMDGFFNGEKYRVPSEFFVHEGVLRKHVKIILEADEMSLKFNRGIVGKAPDAKIYYNKEERSLKINGLSDAMIKKLDKELEQDQFKDV